MSLNEFLASFSFAIFAFLMCLLTIGGALGPDHESCQPEGGELDIPADREFIEIEMPRAMGKSVLSTFPNDPDYDITPANHL